MLFADFAQELSRLSVYDDESSRSFALAAHLNQTHACGMFSAERAFLERHLANCSALNNTGTAAFTREIRRGA